jgi:hypothetical protein
MPIPMAAAAANIVSVLIMIHLLRQPLVRLQSAALVIRNAATTLQQAHNLEIQMGPLSRFSIRRMVALARPAWAAMPICAEWGDSRLREKLPSNRALDITKTCLTG